MTKITIDRWFEAQREEFILTKEHNEEKRRNNVKRIFSLLGEDPVSNFNGKSIVEVGCGSIPALSFVGGLSHRYPRLAIDPLMAQFAEQRKRAEYIGLNVICEPYELVSPLHYNNGRMFDETWFFNVLEHTWDSEYQLRKAMATSKVIRMFEPITGCTDRAHPQVITKKFITDIMGDFGQIYTGNNDGFFEHECYYGTWINDIS